MRTLMTILFCFVYLIGMYSQNIQTQIRDALETPDTAVLTKVYSKRYTIDSLGQIQDIRAVRSDMEYFILDYIPSRYSGQVIEYVNPTCNGNYTEDTFLNSGGVTYPVCFYYKLRPANTPPVNTTNMDVIEVYYKVKIKAFWP